MNRPDCGSVTTDDPLFLFVSALARVSDLDPPRHRYFTPVLSDGLLLFFPFFCLFDVFCFSFIRGLDKYLTLLFILLSACFPYTFIIITIIMLKLFFGTVSSSVLVQYRDRDNRSFALSQTCW